MNKVLVTGSRGFVGTSLCRALGDRAVPFDVAERVQADITDVSMLTKVMSDPDVTAVVHLAAIPGFKQCQDDPAWSHRINVEGTFNVLEAARIAEIEHVVFASSAAAGREHSGMYGAQKAIGERLCMEYRECYNLPTTILRFANLYGEHSRHKGSAIAVWIQKLLASEPIVIHGTGQQKRDLTYIGDVTNFIVTHIIDGVYQERVPLYVGTGVFTSMADAALELMRNNGGGSIQFDIEHDDGGTVERIPETASFMTAMDTHIEEGFEMTWEDYVNNLPVGMDSKTTPTGEGA